MTGPIQPQPQQQQKDPLDFLYKNNPTQTQSQDDPLSFLYSKDPKAVATHTNDSFLGWLGNVGTNWVREGGQKSLVNVMRFLDPLTQSDMLTEPAVQQAGTDLIHVFDHVFDLANPSKVANAVKEQFKGGIGNAVSGMAKGMFTPFTDLMELSSGLQLGENDPRELTPEEKTQRIKNAMGLAAASAVSGPLAGALTKATGSIAGHMLTGVVAGSTFGAVAASNTKDQLGQIIAGGVMGGVLGPAISLLHGESASPRPEEVEQIRQLQIENNTPGQTIKLAQALATSDDIASALVQGKIGLRPGDIHVVPGIDVANLAEVKNDIPAGYRSVVHIDKDGVGRLLVYVENTPGVDEKFFEKNGLVKNQTVSYDGKPDYKIVGQNPDGKINIRNIPGKYNLAVDPTEIRNLPNVEMNRDVAVGRLYDDWKTSLEQGVPKELRTTNEPGKVDNGVPQNIFDRVPDLHKVDLQANLDKWLSAQGFRGDDLTNLKNEFNGKITAEAHGINLTPDEQRLVNTNKAEPQLLETRKNFVTFKQLNRVAKSNGFSISDAGSGRILVRELKSGTVLQAFDTPIEAAKWMNKTGQASGPRLDDNVTMKTEAGDPPPIPPEDGEPAMANDNPYNYLHSPIGKFESMARALDNIRLITRNQDYFKRLDSQYGTNFYNNVFDNLSRAYRVRNAKMVPWMDKVATIIKGNKFTDAERELIFHYSQTMSPTEVMSSYMGRPMNPFEVQMGKSVANSGIDIERVFKYRRELIKLDKEFPIANRVSSPDIESAYQSEVNKMQGAYQIDPTHADFAKQFDQIESMPKNQASLGAIVELSRAINMEGFKGLTQSEFASKYGMSFDQIRAGNQLSAIYKDLAGTFGINANRMLTRYMTHAKLFYDGDVGKAFRNLSGDVKTKDFYAALSRTGEISAYETDPFKAIQRYIKGGFDVSSGFAKTIADAKSAMEDDLKKMPSQAEADNARQTVQRYIDEMQGFPGMTDKALEKGVQMMFDTMHIDKEVNLRSWVSAATNWVAMSGLGARPMLGLGHFGISSIISTAARSLDYTRRVVAAGTRAIQDKDIMQGLQESGVLAGLSPLASMMAAENTSSIRGVGSKVQSALFKSTLLPTVYDGFAAGHYIVTEADALKALTQFQRGDITWGDAKKSIYLDRYDQPVVDKVTQMMQDKKANVTQVADYLGRQAIEDLLGTYGVGNHPYGWDSVFGRTLGQFGNFAMFARGAMQRIVTRGTVADRIGGAAKLAAMSYAVGKVGDKIGIPLNRLSPWHAMFWNLGPLYHIADDVVTAMKATGYEQEAAKRRLLKLSPIDGNGDFQPSIITPGSFAIDGFMKSIQDFSDGNVGKATGEALGFRTKPTPQPGF